MSKIVNNKGSGNSNRKHYEGEIEDLYNIFKGEDSFSWIRYDSVVLYSIRSYTE